MTFAFADFTLNEDLLELRHKGHLVAIQPKVFRLLGYLIENRHRAVPKNELFRSVWPDGVVVPAALTTAIYSLREVLGDNPRVPRFIATVRSTGYRFVASVTPSHPQASSDAPIRQQRHAFFVGRRREMSVFRGGLLQEDDPVQVLYIHGPDGIGKTTLLHEMSFEAERRGARSIWLSGRHMAPRPQAFREAVQGAFPNESTTFPLSSAGEFTRVVLVDGYEALVEIDGWLREQFLSELPRSTRLVLASRLPPSHAWRADLAWQRGVEEIELGPLAESECEELLAARGFARERRGALIREAKGHPLLLALACDSKGASSNVVRDATAIATVRKSRTRTLSGFGTRSTPRAHTGADDGPSSSPKSDPMPH
jgi:DNA-binding winged helix-turn-helix (wHTH) protein